MREEDRGTARRSGTLLRDGAVLVLAAGLAALAVVVVARMLAGGRRPVADAGRPAEAEPPAGDAPVRSRQGEGGTTELMDHRHDGSEGPRRRGSRFGGLLKDGVVPVAAAVAGALVVAGAVDFVDARQDEPEKKKTAKKVAERTGGERKAPGAPRFVVAVRSTGDAVAVRDVRTGAEVGVDVAAPRGRRFHQVASGGDGSYVVSAYASGQITFYRLELATNGTPKRLSQIPGLAVRGVSNTRSDMVVSGDGRRIAYVVYGPGSSRIEIAAPDPTDRRVWATTASGRISSLSWAGDTLSFVWATNRNGTVRRQVRTLDVTGASANLRVSRPVLMLPQGGVAAVLSGDPDTIVAGVHGATALSLEEFSARTGRRTKVLWTHRPARPGQLAALTRDSVSGRLLAAGTNELVYDAPGTGVRGLSAAGFADVAW